MNDRGRHVHARRLTRVGAALAGIAVVFTASACSRAPVRAHTTSVAKLAVTSTLDGLSALPQRIHWQAFPSVPATDVFVVDFLIDGRLGWEERATPYFYGADGNWLVTTFLTPGAHTFTVRVISTTDHTATDTVTASVAPPSGPPAGLSGAWTRTVTAADLQRWTSGIPPPAGRFRLQIGPVGWLLDDPMGGPMLFDVGYESGANLQMRTAIDYPPYPQNEQGGFCEDTDPLWAWTYSTKDGGTTLTLRPAGHDPCGDRVAILAGTWTRAGT